MTSRDFCYWLHGFFELSKAETGGIVGLDAATVMAIRNHLNMVFVHEIDPSHGDATHQAALSAAHGGGGTAQSPKCQICSRLQAFISLQGLGAETEINC